MAKKLVVIKPLLKPVKKKTKPEVKKVEKITTLQKKADKLFSDFIRNRDGWKCLTCGAELRDDGNRANFHCGHYVQRQIIPLRYEEKNAHCQCYHCNVRMKGNYHIYTIKMTSMYGDNILYELDEVYREYKKGLKKYDTEYYKNIISIYSIIEERKC